VKRLVVVLALAAAAPAWADDSAGKVLGQPAPQIALKTAAGKSFSLLEQRGKFVVLHFAASW
jgi:hypothetical protein